MAPLQLLVATVAQVAQVPVQVLAVMVALAVCLPR